MKLFTKADDKKLFAQYAKGSDLDNQDVVVKIFNPYGNGTWFIMNSDPDDPDYLWGIADLGYGAEIGSISRSELEKYKNRFGLGFEKDFSFSPTNAKELYEGLRSGKFYEKGGSFDEFIKKQIQTQKEKEKGESFKKFRVNVYEKGFPFVEPLYTDNFVEAVNFARKKIQEQRAYRSTSETLWAVVDKFVPIEERRNVIYPYSEIARFTESDLSNSKFEKGGKLTYNEIKKRYELLEDLYNNENSKVDYDQILKVGDVIYGDDIVGYLRIKEEINDPKKGDYFIMQDRYNNKYGFYIVQSVRDLYSKQIFIKNVGVSEDKFLHSKELISLYKEIQFLKGRISLYEKNPNDASNYHGINYQDYLSAKSELSELMEEFRIDSRNEKIEFEDGGQLEMKFAKGGALESKIGKKVSEINALIEKAIDKDGDPIPVVDSSGTWEEPMIYKPIIYKNGKLIIEYFEPYSGKTEKEIINKSNMEFDGYETLLNIAKMYRKALRQKVITYSNGGQINIDIPTELQSKMSERELKMYDSYVNHYNEMQDDLENLKKAKRRKDNEDVKYYNRRIANRKYSIKIIASELSKNENLKKYVIGLQEESDDFEKGGKTTFKEKATAIAKKFVGKKVEPKYQKEYGKTYDKKEAQEVGNKIAGSQKAKYDSKMSKGGTTKRGGVMLLAKQIRKDGESWASAMKRAGEQLKKK